MFWNWKVIFPNLVSLRFKKDVHSLMDETLPPIAEIRISKSGVKLHLCLQENSKNVLFSSLLLSMRIK